MAFLFNIFLIAGTLSSSSFGAPQPQVGLITRTSAKSLGCGNAVPSGQTPGENSYHISNFNTSDDATRSFRLHIPPTYDKDRPVPLIFSFHGHGKDSDNQEKLSEFSDAKYNPDAFAVYPDGLPLSGGENSQGWRGDPRHNTTNDKRFVTDMIAHFSNTYCIDTARIYATGKSNGGGFTGHVLASCETHAQRQNIVIPCSPARANVPVLEFHGSADETIPYAGDWRNGACLPTIPRWVREWSKRDGMALTNKTTSLKDGNVLKYEYGTGERQGMVTHYWVGGLRHWWPSTKPNVDNKGVTTVIDATPIIMEFFNKHSLEL